MNKIVLIIVCLALPAMATSPKESPLHQPTTLLYGGAVVTPQSQWLNSTLPPAKKLQTAWQVGLGLELPLLQYLNAGLTVDMSGGYGDSAFYTSLSGFVKALYPVYTAMGDLAPYIKVPVGLGLGVNPQLMMDIASLTMTSPVGVGLQTSGLAGIEYFPIEELGIYLEAGYQVRLLAYRTGIPMTQEASPWKYMGIFQQAPVAFVGVLMNFL